MQQVSKKVAATEAQLGQIDAAMQAQEDARPQWLMNHENNLISQLTSMS